MDAIWALVGTVVGLILGAVVVWRLISGREKDLKKRLSGFEQKEAEFAAARDKLTEVTTLLSTRDQQIEELKQEVARGKDQLGETERRYQEINVTLNSERSRIDAREKALEEAKQSFEEVKKQFKDIFENISNEAIKKSGEELLKRYQDAARTDDMHRRQEIAKMLEPTRGEIKKLEEINHRLEKQFLEESTTLKNELTTLSSTNNKLVNALKGSGSAGLFGEELLEQLIESAGFKLNINYFRQGSLETEEGRQRPDVQILLAGGRRIIIDAKSPVHEFTEGENDQDHEAYCKHVARRVLDHARKLGKKDYAKLDEAPDFTIMFIPSEALFRYALEGRPKLLEEMRECNVIVASPTTLLAMLKVIMVGWSHKAVAEEAHNIQQLGKKLYDAVLKLASGYEQLGRQLATATNTYNRVGRSLDSTVLNRARKMSEAGIQAKERINEFAPVEVEIQDLRSAKSMEALMNEQLALE